MLMKTNQSIVAIAFWLASLGTVFGAALTPAVNAPMLSMAGGTAGSTIWSPTATVPITTTAETSCLSSTGQGPGQTITPSTNPVAPYIGNAFLLQCTGVYSTPTANVATITPKIKWGSVTVAGGTASSGLQASATNFQWTLTGMCTIITISASANSSTVMCSGTFTYAQGLTGSSIVTTSFQSTSPVSVDTVSAFKPDLTLTWSSVATGQAATGLMGLVQILF
jgi:hypothetical protein